MTALPASCVVDASVGVALMFDEPLSAASRRLFGAAADGACACGVHELFYLECASAARKHVLRGRFTALEVVDRYASLLEQPLRLHEVLGLSAATLSQSLGRGISAYDASYVVLARHLEVPLITADERLARSMEGMPVEVVRLADIEV